MLLESPEVCQFWCNIYLHQIEYKAFLRLVYICILSKNVWLSQECTLYHFSVYVNNRFCTPAHNDLQYIFENATLNHLLYIRPVANRDSAGFWLQLRSNSCGNATIQPKKSVFQTFIKPACYKQMHNLHWLNRYWLNFIVACGIVSHGQSQTLPGGRIWSNA